MKASLWRDYEVDQEKIEQLRILIFQYCKENPEKIDMDDVRNRILSPEDVANNNMDQNNNKTSDWMLKRFLIASHKKVDAALQQFVDFFTFRKNYQMAQMNEENVLPKEFFELHPFDCEGIDKDGNRVLTVRLKYYRKLPQFEVLIKRGIMYFAEKLDLEYEQGLCNGVCLVLDAQDFSVTNLDMDLLQFIAKQVPTSYSGLMRSALVYEISFLLSYLLKVVEAWMPTSTDKAGNKRKFFHSINKKNIKEFIDDDQRPDFMDGSRAVNKVVPPTTVPFEQMVRGVPGIDEPSVKKIQEYLGQLCSA